MRSRWLNIIVVVVSYLFVEIIWTAEASSISTHGQCYYFEGSYVESLAPSYLSVRHSICSDVVEYPFYIPFRVNSTFLESEARAEFSKRSLSALPESCQTSLKRAICAFIYPRCPSDSAWSWANLTTWSREYIDRENVISTTNLSYLLLPYRRPCLSLCKNLHSTCHGLLDSLLDVGPISRHLRNCSSRTSYSPASTGRLALPSSPSSSSYMLLDSSYWNPSNIISLPTYVNDSTTESVSGTQNVCNSMSGSSDYAVANASEPYLYARTTKPNDDRSGANYGACSGVIKRVYVPSYGLQWSSSSVQLDRVIDDVDEAGPMQAPYVYQRAVDALINSTLSTLPLWLDSRCYLAARKYLCSIGMQGYETVKLSIYQNLATGASFVVRSSTSVSASYAKFLRQYDAYVPSYTSRSVCEDYVSTCGTFISEWGSSYLEGNRSLSSYPFSSLLRLPTCQAKQVVDLGDQDDATLDISLFPTSSQVVLKLRQTIREGAQYSSALTLDLATLPNTLPDFSSSLAESMWTTTCPSVFVVPDDVSSDRNIWLKGTGCAEPCR
jgi:hypothetical protein